MEVIVTGVGVSSVTYICDYLALPDKFVRHNSIGITLQVSIVKNQLLVGAELVDRGAAAFTLEQLGDLSIRGCQHRCARWRRNIYRVVSATFRSCVGKRVQQLVWFDAGNRNYEFKCADKTS